MSSPDPELDGDVNKLFALAREYYNYGDPKDKDKAKQKLSHLIYQRLIDELESLKIAITNEKTLSGWGVIEERIAELNKLVGDQNG